MYTLPTSTAFMHPSEGPVLRALLSIAEPITVLRGETVMTEGETADAMYVVESGCLDVTLSEAPGAVTVLRRGALFGELAVISGQPRSATVTARVISQLHRIAADDFFALFSKFPDVSPIVMRHLAIRLIESMPRPVSGARTRPTVTFVAAGGNAQESLVFDVTTALHREFEATGLGAESIDLTSNSTLAQSDSGAGTLGTRLQARAGAPTFVLTDERSPLFDQAIAAADRVVIVAGEGSTPGAQAELLRKADLLYAGAVDLAAWDLAVDPMCLYRWDTTSSTSAATLARRLSGRSIGLVLSAGGARALAHLGVVAEIVDRGIVIDRISATSMGSFIGARIALGHSPADAADFFRRLFLEEQVFLRYGAEAIHMLAEEFGGIRVEDLPIQFSCVSTDLVTGRAVVRRYGPLSSSLHASMALPGLVAPIVSEGRVLIDGAAVDGFPVERMNEEQGGPILASDVTGRIDRMQRWASKWTDSQSPDHLDVAIQAMDIATMDSTARGRQLADVLFRPAVPGGTLAFDKIDAFVEAGRQHAATVLDAPGDDALSA